MRILSNSDLPKTAEILNNGQIGVIPTDTVYGLACLANNQGAVKRLYGLKSRDNKPGTVIAANIDQIVGLGIPKRYLTAVAAYWPNPISIIIPSVPELAYLDLGKQTIAFRVPSDTHIIKLLEQTGPLLTSSANLPGQPPANNIDEAQSYFDDEVDFYVDGGDLSNRESSTVIRIVDDAVEVIRQGELKINEKGEIADETR